MQHQTVPQTETGTVRVAFDVMAGIEPLTFPADATTAQITDRLRAAFLAADVIRDGHELGVAIDIEAGTVAVSVDGDVIEHGSITREQPKPDYWLTLADAIHQHADRIATLAGTDWKPTYAGLSISMADPGNRNAVAGDMVDVVADVFGLTAKTVKSSGGYYERTASGNLDGLRFSVYGYVPEPEDAEKAAMRAELEALRAQLAEGGATR